MVASTRVIISNPILISINVNNIGLSSINTSTTKRVRNMHTHEISDKEIMTSLAKTIGAFCVASVAMAVTVWFFAG